MHQHPVIGSGSQAPSGSVPCGQLLQASMSSHAAGCGLTLTLTLSTLSLILTENPAAMTRHQLHWETRQHTTQCC